MDPRLCGDDGLALNSPRHRPFADFFTRSFAGMTLRKVRGCSFTLRVRSKNAVVVLRLGAGFSEQPHNAAAAFAQGISLKLATN
jgi:hypothetical protein